jgi:hypothetical protein
MFYVIQANYGKKGVVDLKETIANDHRSIFQELMGI